MLTGFPGFVANICANSLKFSKPNQLLVIIMQFMFSVHSVGGAGGEVDHALERGAGARRDRGREPRLHGGRRYPMLTADVKNAFFGNAFFENAANFWRARSRLYRSRFLQVNTKYSFE